MKFSSPQVLTDEHVPLMLDKKDSKVFERHICVFYC